MYVNIYIYTCVCRVDTSRIGNAIRRDIRRVGLVTNHGRRRRRRSPSTCVYAPLIRSVLGQQWIMATVATRELVGFFITYYHTYIFIIFNGLAGIKCNTMQYGYLLLRTNPANEFDTVVIF